MGGQVRRMTAQPRPRVERIIGVHMTQVFIALVKAGFIEPAWTDEGPSWHWPADPRLRAIAVNAAIDQLGVRPSWVDPPEYNPEADWEAGQDV